MTNWVFKAFIIGVALFLLGSMATACSERSSDRDGTVLIGVNPPSLVIGESIIAELRTDLDFFENDLDESIVSDGGLVLQSVSVQGPRRAKAVLVSSEQTVFGNHVFRLTGKTGDARVVFSVLTDSPGPGEIESVEGNTLTAGAQLAPVIIWGDNTYFDPNISFNIRGTKGLKIINWIVSGRNKIELFVDVDLKQKPMSATIVINDGDYIYEIPITILAPVEYESRAQTFAVKGQVSWVKVEHPDAVLNTSMVLKTNGVEVETGPSRARKDNMVEFPVRFPLDASEESVHLQAWVHLHGGATLQIINFDVAVLEPIGVVPGELVLEEDKTGHLPLCLKGFSFDDIVDIKAKSHSGLIILGFERTNEDCDTVVNIKLNDEGMRGPFVLDVLTKKRSLSVGFWQGNETGWANWSHNFKLYPGDEVYFPIVAHGIDSAENWVIDIEEGLSLEAKEIFGVSALYKLKISNDINAGFKEIIIESGRKRIITSVEVLDIKFKGEM